MRTNERLASAAASGKRINKIPEPLKSTWQVDSSDSADNNADFDAEVKAYCYQLSQNQSGDVLRLGKVIIVGDMGVGKTSLVRRFVSDTFSNEYKATIGVDFEVEQFRVLELPFNMQIWDTAGQERFRCIAAAYYRGAQAIMVTFDLIDAMQSLESAEVWLKEALSVAAQQHRNDSLSATTAPIVFLIGTKKDLLDYTSDSHRNRTHEMANELAQRINGEYWPVSSFTGENVKRLFYRLAALMFQNTMRKEISTARADLGSGANKRSIVIDQLVCSGANTVKRAASDTKGDLTRCSACLI